MAMDKKPRTPEQEQARNERSELRRLIAELPDAAARSAAIAALAAICHAGPSAVNITLPVRESELPDED